MPKEKETAPVRQGRELVKQSKQLCDVSRQRIKLGKRLREDVVERTSEAEGKRRKLAENHKNRAVRQTGH